MWNRLILAALLSIGVSNVTAAQPKSATQRLVEQLTLTPDQKTKLDPVLADDAQKLRAIRQDSTLSADDKKTKSAAVRQDTEAKLKATLTGDQWKQYKKLKEERRSAAKKK